MEYGPEDKKKNNGLNENMGFMEQDTLTDNVFYVNLDCNMK